LSVPAAPIPAQDATITGHTTAPAGGPLSIVGTGILNGSGGNVVSSVVACTTAATDGTFAFHAVPSGFAYQLYRRVATSAPTIHSAIAVHAGTNPIYLGY
jgi:acyl CoA:acetate/3-ketoacid CoA transferase